MFCSAVNSMASLCASSSTLPLAANNLAPAFCANRLMLCTTLASSDLPLAMLTSSPVLTVRCLPLCRWVFCGVAVAISAGEEAISRGFW
ncbi:hypothetical protein D3C76_1152430 [compost metagenome]